MLTTKYSLNWLREKIIGKKKTEVEHHKMQIDVEVWGQPESWTGVRVSGSGCVNLKMYFRTYVNGRTIK